MSNYAAIPEPSNTLEGLRDSVTALKQIVETLTQQRGAPNKPAGAVTFADLISLGLISADYTTTTYGNIGTHNASEFVLSSSAANSIKGNNTGAIASAIDLTVAQTQTLLGVGSQMPGTTTNDSATAGNIGEYVSANIATGSAVSLVSETAKTVTSISLTAGDWDVSILGKFLGAGTTTVNRIVASVSLATNTLDATIDRYTQVGGAGGVIFNNAGGEADAVVPSARLSLSGTTTVFFVALAGFSVSTCTAAGIIRARRRR